MNNYAEQLQAELNTSQCMPLFEIRVLARDGSVDHVYGEVFFSGNSLIFQRDAVTTKELNSKYLASTRMVVDSAFTLDDHLSELHEKARDDISDGDLFDLADY